MSKRDRYFNGSALSDLRMNVSPFHTQEALGIKLQELLKTARPFSKQRVGGWEAGAFPGMEVVTALVRYYKVTLDDLLVEGRYVPFKDKIKHCVESVANHAVMTIEASQVAPKPAPNDKLKSAIDQLYDQMDVDQAYELKKIAQEIVAGKHCHCFNGGSSSGEGSGAVSPPPLSTNIPPPRLEDIVFSQKKDS